MPLTSGNMLLRGLPGACRGQPDRLRLPTVPGGGCAGPRDPLDARPAWGVGRSRRVVAGMGYGCWQEAGGGLPADCGQCLVYDKLKT
jgi:hypothetical protein